MRLSDVRLLADDVEGCVAFYRDALGLEVTLAAGEGIYYELGGGDVRLAIYRRGLMGAWLGVDEAFPVPSGDRVLLAFEVDDVDRAFADMSQRGVEFVTRPRDHTEAYIRTAHVRDPDGNLVELFARLPSAAARDQ